MCAYQFHLKAENYSIFGRVSSRVQPPNGTSHVVLYPFEPQDGNTEPFL